MKSTFKKFLMLVAIVGLSNNMHGGAIHRAVAKKDLQKVKKILEKDPDKANQKALFTRKGLLYSTLRVFKGDTPLQVAARSDKSGEVIVPIAELLLSKGANVFAVGSSYNSGVGILLLNHGAPLSKDFSLRSIQWWRGLTAAKFAAVAIEHGADIFRVGTHGTKSALAKLFEIYRPGGRTIVYWDKRIMKAMLRKHRDKIFTKPVFVWANTKLNKARRLQAYKLFVADDIRRKFPQNKTALHHAATSGDVDLASYLIENGAADDLKAKTTGNQMPIHLAKDLGMRAYLRAEMKERKIPVE